MTTLTKMPSSRVSNLIGHYALHNKEELKHTQITNEYEITGIGKKCLKINDGTFLSWDDIDDSLDILLEHGELSEVMTAVLEFFIPLTNDQWEKYLGGRIPLPSELADKEEVEETQRDVDEAKLKLREEIDNIHEKYGKSISEENKGDVLPKYYEEVQRTIAYFDNKYHTAFWNNVQEGIQEFINDIDENPIDPEIYYQFVTGINNDIGEVIYESIPSRSIDYTIWIGKPHEEDSFGWEFEIYMHHGGYWDDDIEYLTMGQVNFEENPILPKFVDDIYNEYLELIIDSNNGICDNDIVMSTEEGDVTTVHDMYDVTTENGETHHMYLEITGVDEDA